MKDDLIKTLEKDFLRDERTTGGAVPINFKRVLGLAVRYWYLIVLSVLSGLFVAFLVNRYTNKIYAVSASIIVREGNENAAAEFLYKSNPLINPYRNFYNELYIMRSYPLLQEVIENLNLMISWHREGNIKTTEIYRDDSFPIDLRVVHADALPYGRTFGFTVESDSTYQLHYLVKGENVPERTFSKLSFDDTVSVDKYRFFTTAYGPVRSLIGKQFMLSVRDPFQIAREYSTRLRANWAEVGSSVINLEVSGASPRKEVDFLNKFIDRYQRYDVDKKNLVATRSIEFLEKQLSNIGDSLKLFEDKIESFRQENSDTDFDAASERIYTKISSLEEQLALLKLNSSYYTYLENYLKAGKDYDQIVPPSIVGIEDNVISRLIQELIEVQFSMRMLGNQQSEQNPLVVGQRVRIAQLKQDILEGVKSIRDAQAIRQNFLEDQVKISESQLATLPATQRQMVDINRNHAIKENLYIFLMQKRAEAGISRASTTSDIVIVNPPTVRGGPITPKPLQNYGIGVLIGLLVPFIAFFVAELLNNKIQSSDDISQLTSIPLVGGIGHNAYRETTKVTFARPKSAMAESFRALRSSLAYFVGTSGKKIVLVTSSVSNEGKTFTTINLAIVVAFSGRKVLVVGADMRKPSIYGDFNLQNEKGLSTYLSSMADLDAVIQKTDVEGLELISAGQIPPNPSELLLSEKAGAMLEELKKRYDYILLDTPPLGLVSDAFALMPYVDHTIFVVRQNYTPKAFLKDIQVMFETRKIDKISILFNDIVKTGPGYGSGYSYGYGYNYGYGYGGSNGSGYYTE